MTQASVLVVEDNDLERQITADTLREEGFAVEEAAVGKRAMELLKDGTGTFILMGSAADQVSYEASRYGEGLLTYALLEGMRGAALKDATRLNVSEWFRQASERVPEKNELLPLEELERRAILRTLRETSGDKLAAARILGIGKTTLYRKLKQYHLGAQAQAGV